MAAGVAEKEPLLKEEEAGLAANEEDDELDSKERVLQRYFLQEWQLVKSLLDDILCHGRVRDISSVHKIRSIVLSLSLPIENLLFLRFLLYLQFLRFFYSFAWICFGWHLN